MEKVILGMPGPWAKNDREAADHYTTKVGGLPDWPITELNPDLLWCRSCGEKLYLVAQVYAPLSSSDLNEEERTIYVLGCSVAKCSSSSNSWRSLRVQKFRGGAQLKSSSQEEEICAKGLSCVSSGSNLLTTDTRTQAYGGQNDSNSGGSSLQDLCQAISEAASVSSCAKKHNAPVSSGVAKKHARMKPKINESSEPVLPCFYIYNEEERPSRSTNGIESQYSSLSIKDDQSSHGDPVDDEKWEVESYEYDRALGADRTYLKFKKKLESYPEQCIRYALGGKPLLATKDVEEPGKCGVCGAQRQFEMQLMPPLLYFLQQAADGRSTYSPEGWSWLTLIICTCSKNCSDHPRGKSLDSCWTVSEESIVVQLE